MKIGTTFKGSLQDLWDHLKKQEQEQLDKKLLADKGFDCKCCGEYFIPKQDQCIFYDLCNECFSKFDAQKMRARFSTFGGGEPIPGFEDENEWIKSQK